MFSFHEAEQVLNEFRDKFIEDMDAEKVLWDLLEKGIIDGGNLRAITESKDTIQQNKMLHLCLKQKCTLKAFKTVCEVIIEVKGYPKMRALGEDMRQKLETGVCVCVCMWSVCMCVCV